MMARRPDSLPPLLGGPRDSPREGPDVDWRLLLVESGHLFSQGVRFLITRQTAVGRDPL